MTNSVIRQIIPAPASVDPGLVFELLVPGTALPPSLAALVARGLADGERFLEQVVPNWTRPDGPYADPRAIMLVVWKGQEAVALAGVVLDTYAADPDTGRLKHVYVRPDMRRKGIADAMVQACLARAGDRFRRLRLRAATPDAARLYERHGFEHLPDEPDATHVRAGRRDGSPAGPAGGGDPPAS